MRWGDLAKVFGVQELLVNLYLGAIVELQFTILRDPQTVESIAVRFAHDQFLCCVRRGRPSLRARSFAPAKNGRAR